MPSSLVEGYFDSHLRGNSVPEFSGIGFGIMVTIFLEHKGTSNMRGNSQEKGKLMSSTMRRMNQRPHIHHVCEQNSKRAIE